MVGLMVSAAAEQLWTERRFLVERLPSPVVADVLARGTRVICKPWVARNGDRFTKADFIINMRLRTIECPAGEVEYLEPGKAVEFDSDACSRCKLRANGAYGRQDPQRSDRNWAADERLSPSRRLTFVKDLPLTPSERPRAQPRLRRARRGRPAPP
jgi:hypothetical protein